jgi:Na+-driven multidrug efflux pump
MALLPCHATHLRLPCAQLFAERLLAMTGAHASVVPLSCLYLKIRAVAQPAVMIIMTCQASLIAQRDSFTPFLSVLLSTSVNFLGNIIFVAWLGMGLAGAAWTTVATQYVGASALALALMFRSKVRCSCTSMQPAGYAAALLLLRFCPCRGARDALMRSSCYATSLSRCEHAA